MAQPPMAVEMKITRMEPCLVGEDPIQGRVLALAQTESWSSAIHSTNRKLFLDFSFRPTDS
jgi:hypothetical protein